MTAKDDFMEKFEAVVECHPSHFVSLPKEFAYYLNENPHLRTLFREAVAEATGLGDDADITGLQLLFPKAD